MMTYLHFMASSLTSFFSKKDRFLSFLAAGFIGICSDFDLFFNWMGYDLHRGFFHSIPFSIILGVLTYFLFKSFLMGFLAHAIHLVLDIIDPIGGSVMVTPQISLSFPIPINREIVSGVIGTVILVFWIIYGYYKSDKK